MKLSTLTAAVALALAGVATPALAQPAIAVGATIYGPDGAEVGTIDKVQGEVVVVNTGTMTAALPANSFGTGEKGPTLGWTRAQLEAAVSEANQKSEAALEAALVAGTDVYSSDDVAIGKVKEVTADGLVVVELAGGPASLPKTQMTMDGDKLTFLATAADIEAAASAAQGGD